MIKKQNRFSQDIENKKLELKAAEEDIRKIHRKIIVFADKVREVMGLTEDELRFAVYNDMYWEIGDYTIAPRFETLLGMSDQLYFKILEFRKRPLNIVPSRKKQEEILILIEKNKYKKQRKNK